MSVLARSRIIRRRHRAVLIDIRLIIEHSRQRVTIARKPRGGSRRSARKRTCLRPRTRERRGRGRPICARIQARPSCRRRRGCSERWRAQTLSPSRHLRLLRLLRRRHRSPRAERRSRARRQTRTRRRPVRRRRDGAIDITGTDSSLHTTQSSSIQSHLRRRVLSRRSSRRRRALHLLYCPRNRQTITPRHQFRRRGARDGRPARLARRVAEGA